MSEVYVDIVLPLAQSWFTYRVGSELVSDIEPGQCVEVSFGVRKILTGIVWRVHNEKPPYKNIKTVERRVPHSPTISPQHRQFWDWVSSYYMCTIGEVMRAALPSALKPEGFSVEEFLGDSYRPRRAKKGSKEELPAATIPLPILSPAQSDAFGSIQSLFETKDAVLLHGVTGSGKTEIYISLIAQTLSRGQDALYLLPEIALTAQLIERLRRYFGDRVVTYHSKFTEKQRTESYLKAAACLTGQLVIGVRSAIFLPANRLGLVIIDEEHESSFKQADPAPRYNARDSAVVLASIWGAKIVLGSATPSIESYVNATEGKYGYVTLDERYAGGAMPQIIVSNSIIAAKRGERRVHFNKILLDKISVAVESNRQVMLFQNRRGFSPYVECPECGWVAMCPDCNVTLTLHKADNRLKCHYCGYQTSPPEMCPACSKGRVETRGFGTEKIEQELQTIFPDIRIARLDRDTTQTQRGFKAIITAFERGETDILVGTQMITKGFDFAGVSLVGILNADNLLNYPDFRAAERAFQLMTQVAGRAGRREVQGEVQGEVVIQTSQSEDNTIKQVASSDYQSMVRTQLAQRREFNYPPYCRIISITLRHRDKGLVWRAAQLFAIRARDVFAARLLGPEPPPVDKIKGEHIVSFMLKVERTGSYSKAKDLLREIMGDITMQQEFKYITIVWNVDPV